MQHRFACEHCGKHLSYRLDQFGMRIKCPKCGQMIHVGVKSQESGSAEGGGVAFLSQNRWRVAFVFGLLAVAGVMLWRAFNSW
jgi:DNA-directed RNA polymerase subunit RPC12/RpoP